MQHTCISYTILMQSGLFYDIFLVRGGAFTTFMVVWLDGWVGGWCGNWRVMLITEAEVFFAFNSNLNPFQGRF